MVFTKIICCSRATKLAMNGSSTHFRSNFEILNLIPYKSSAEAEPAIGDRGHNRHGPKGGGGDVPLSLGTRLIQWGLRRYLLPYQVASSFIQLFGHNSVGCHSPQYQLLLIVVEMHTVTVRSDDARYLLN